MLFTLASTTRGFHLFAFLLTPVTPLREVQQVVWNQFSQGVPPNQFSPIWRLVPWKKLFTIYPVQWHYSRSKSLQREQCNSGQLTQCTVEVPRQHDEHVHILEK